MAINEQPANTLRCGNIKSDDRQNFIENGPTTKTIISYRLLRLRSTPPRMGLPARPLCSSPRNAL